MCSCSRARINRHRAHVREIQNRRKKNSEDTEMGERRESKRQHAMQIPSRLDDNDGHLRELCAQISAHLDTKRQKKENAVQVIC